MKIGILTFHSQLNYGGVLQALALQTALQTSGHEVVIIDKWLDRNNSVLRGPFRWLSFGQRFKWLVRCLGGCGDSGLALRHWRTMRFVKQLLRRTPYHFCDWSEMAGKALGVDLLVVGSDQVWNPSWGQGYQNFLLVGMTQSVPAIAYAASFGVRALPGETASIFREGFKRFRAISVRESEGVALVASQGGQATHVMDPTQLLSRQQWQTLLTLPETTSEGPIVCYCLGENALAVFKRLRQFAQQHHCRIKLYSDRTVAPVPRNLKAVYHNWTYFHDPYVEICNAADPQQFVRDIVGAKGVVTDSFHGLMFASIFSKQVQIVRPNTPSRQGMFARIEEFVQRYGDPSMFVSTIEEGAAQLVQGLPSAQQFNESALTQARAASVNWLTQQIDATAQTCASEQ